MNNSKFILLMIALFTLATFLPTIAQAQGVNPLVCTQDVFPVRAELVGGSNSEKLQGFESNDTLSGGGGPDLFPLTTGNDVILDFDPTQDMLDVGDFARAEGGFGVLTSIFAIVAYSTEQMVNGQLSTVINVDGNTGTSTVTLIGVRLQELNERNVFFGLDGTSIPPLNFTHIPQIKVTYSNGDVVLLPAHAFGANVNPELLEGNGCSIAVEGSAGGEGDEDGEEPDEEESDGEESDDSDVDEEDVDGEEPEEEEAGDEDVDSEETNDEDSDESEEDENEDEEDDDED
jgi:hypothetical protein